MENDGNNKVENRASVLVTDSLGLLIVRIFEDFERRQSDRFGNAVDPVFIMLTVLLFQFRIPNFSALVFWFNVFDGFVLIYWIDRSNCALKTILVRSACAFETQYFLRL